MSEDFRYSVIRIVPDPVKDEAINVGCVVVTSDGSTGRLAYTKRFRSRLSTLKKGYPYESAVAAIEELKVLLGVEGQLSFGATASKGKTTSLLEAAASRLEGQLQLMAPRTYRAKNLRCALDELFQRFVTERLPSPDVHRQPTAAEMRRRIWQTVSAWSTKNVIVESSSWLQGSKAKHRADFIVRNGVPRAAIFALPAADEERALAFLYRDSLPTIARDVSERVPNFRVVGVVPDVDQDTPESIRGFISETRSLLSRDNLIHTISMSELSSIETEVTTPLL